MVAKWRFEAVPSNMGCIPPVEGFLEAIVSLCKQHGAVSIFDEVMTGFRVARGCAQGRFGVTPDLTALGKVVGGGMPLAVYGGRRDVMSVVAPLGPVYQAGTLSGNPVAPQCGCDGVTYDCECQRLKAGVGLAEEGLCPETCDTNEDCTEESNFCKKELGDCSGEGVCDKKPLVFTCLSGPGGVLSNTACGCDGVNYESVCHAHAAGVSVHAKDECP